MFFGNGTIAKTKSSGTWCEPCSQCLISWHQRRKYWCHLTPLHTFCLCAHGFCLRGYLVLGWSYLVLRWAYLVLRWAYAELTLTRFLLTPHPYKGPLPKHERQGLDRGSCENEVCFSLSCAIWLSNKIIRQTAKKKDSKHIWQQTKFCWTLLNYRGSIHGLASLIVESTMFTFIMTDRGRDSKSDTLKWSPWVPTWRSCGRYLGWLW